MQPTTRLPILLLIASALALALAGCTSTPAQPYARCTLPYTRDAGLGVQVPGCHAWEIGTLSPPPDATKGPRP